MSAPKRQRTTSMQTRSSVGTETSKEPVGSPNNGTPPHSSSVTSQSSHGSSNYQGKVESPLPIQHAATGIATRTRASSTTTRRHQSRSEGSVPDTSTVSFVNQSSFDSSSSSAATSSSSEASSQNNPSVTHIDNATTNKVVLWIRENYEEMMNFNVPRSGIYEHYRHFCALNRCELVNAATFGKLIRVAFPNITTRRLGNRGQSKYQYCNIQRRDKDASATGGGTDGSTETNINNRQPNEKTLSASSSSALIDVSRDSTAVANALADFYVNRDDGPATRASSSDQATTSASLPPLVHDHQLTQHHRRAYIHHPQRQRDTLPSGSDHSSSSARRGSRGFPSYRLPPPIGFETVPPTSASAPTPSSSSSSSSLASTYLPNSNLLLDPSASPSQPALPSPRQPPSSSVILSPNEYRPSAITTSSSTLPSSSELIPSSLYSRSSNTRDSPSMLSQFTDYYHRHCDTIFGLIRAGNFSKVEETYKTFYGAMPTSFRSLMSTPELIESIWRWDCVLYDAKQTISELRYFTKNLPQYLSFTLQNYPETLKKKKVDVATIFVAKMRRHLTLNQFAIAAGDVVHQRALLEAMASDWKSLDIGAILDHVLWVCDCRNDTMHYILAEEIPHLLLTGSTLNQWMKWEQEKIDMFLIPLTKIHDVQNINEFLTKAKQFILKWKMYTGLVMQQFYIKGIKSIDSFKTLQFFLDDLILYHVEERIAIINVNVNKRLGSTRNPVVNTPVSPTE